MLSNVRRWLANLSGASLPCATSLSSIGVVVALTRPVVIVALWSTPCRLPWSVRADAGGRRLAVRSGKRLGLGHRSPRARYRAGARRCSG